MSDYLATLPPRKILEIIQDILWPPENPDEQWTPETLEIIADTMHRAGYSYPEDMDGRAGAPEAQSAQSPSVSSQGKTQH